MHFIEKVRAKFLPGEVNSARSSRASRKFSSARSCSQDLTGSSSFDLSSILEEVLGFARLVVLGEYMYGSIVVRRAAVPNIAFIFASVNTIAERSRKLFDCIFVLIIKDDSRG